MRTALLLGLVLLAQFVPRAQSTPSFYGQPDRVAQLQAENARLEKSVHYHAALVRRLQRALRSEVRLGASGVERGFMCIHYNPRVGHGEGAWNDPNPPYWGGVQMDLSFMRTYGGPFLRALGTAEHWTPAMQIVTAERAYYSGRGFYPWPNTARSCGLL